VGGKVEYSLYLHMEFYMENYAKSTKPEQALFLFYIKNYAKSNKRKQAPISFFDFFCREGFSDQNTMFSFLT
jgi:hypothetical protein